MTPCLLDKTAKTLLARHKGSSWDQQSSTDTVNSTEEFSVESTVPSSLWLKPSLRDNVQKLGKIPLAPLNMTFGVVNPKPAVSMRAALRHERQSSPSLHNKNKSVSSSDITVVFAVRHPGCAQCREHGQQLSDLLAETTGPMQGVHAWGIVKEAVSQQDPGLLGFYNDYFHYPLYVDDKWSVYQAMGGRRLCPIKGLKLAIMSRSRWARKGIFSQVKCGDAFMQGGVLIFKRGTLRFALEEAFGKEMDVDAIRIAVQALKEEDSSSLTSTENMSLSSMSVETSRSFVSTRTEI